MSKQRLLQHGRLLPSLEEQLALSYDVHALWQEPDPDAFLKNHGADFPALATSARTGASAKLIDALPSLKVITSFGVGYETIDIEAARKRGVQVGYTPGVLNDCVADTAFGLLLDVARRLSASDRFVRSGKWLQGSYPLATRVSGKRLGFWAWAVSAGW